MPNFTIANAGFGFAGLDLDVSATGEVFFADAGEDMTFTTTDADWPGTYTITAAQLAALQNGDIVFVAFRAPTGLSDPPADGDVATAREPLVVWRKRDGAPDLTLAWMGAPANSAATYTVTTADLSNGISIEWTAVNQSDAFVETQQVTAAAIWNNWVQQVGDSFLTAPAGAIESNFTQGTLFMSFRLPPAAAVDIFSTVQRPFRFFTNGTQPHIMYQYMNTDGSPGLFAPAWRLDQAPLSAAGYSDWAAQDMNVLFVADHPNARIAIQKADGTWVSHVIGTASGAAFRGSRLQIFASTDQNVALRRVAWWTGVAADVTDSAVQNLFAFSGGGLVNPATSRASLGAPLIDIYGTAADWSAGTNNGSIGDLAVTGSFEVAS